LETLLADDKAQICFSGDKVQPKPSKFGPAEWLRELDRLRGDPIFPDGRIQPPMQELDFSDFDQ